MKRLTIKQSGVGGGSSAPIRMAILLAIVAGFAFTLSFACIKALGKDIPVQQVMFFRMFVGILVLTPMLLRAPRSIWKSSRPFGHLYRILAGFASMMLLYWAAARMPLALLTATQFMMPLFVTMLSIPLLQESVGWRRALATLLGFGGVLLMIQPGEEGILGVELAYIAAIASALFYALAVIAMRQLGRTEPVLRTTLYFSAVAALASGIACLFGWVNPTLNQWLLLICTGIAGGIGQFAMVGAYKMAPATVVAPFDYMQMVWATAIGFIIWLEIPTIHTLLGASVVILSGFYIFRREAAARKKFA